MEKYWKEPLDPARHLDHFFPGSARPRASDRPSAGFSDFVEVVGFAFQFASTEQLRECLAFFEQRIHPSSLASVFGPEKGHGEAWHERLAAHVLKASRRERALAALASFSKQHPERTGLITRPRRRGWRCRAQRPERPDLAKWCHQ